MLNMASLRHIHFVGIGGAGMSGIAEVLVTQGYKVSGSDMSESLITRHLHSLGVSIRCGHDGANVAGADVVVYSSAIAADNLELVAARAAHIPILARAQMLAGLMQNHYGIAIAGTHGKTTTTGLVTTVMTEGGLDPTFVIGGLLRSAGTHARLGASQYIVVEADESDASFLYLQPKVAVVTNIDSDHLNNYGDFAKLRQTFIEFLHRLPEDGLAVVCSDDAVVEEILPLIERPTLTYGFKETDDVRALEFQQHGVCCHMKVARKGHSPLDVVLNLPGRHNVLNALATIAVATHCGVDDVAIVRALAQFQGTGRRFEIYGDLDIDKGKVLMIDDYGHHPREIAATLAAIRNAWPSRRLVVAFQPHRYSRTKAIFNDFVQALSLPDVLVLLDIYAAGEAPIPGINGEGLCDGIRHQGKIDPIFVQRVNQLAKVLQHVLKDGDILLLQGAGDISKVASNLAVSGLKFISDAAN